MNVQYSTQNNQLSFFLPNHLILTSPNPLILSSSHHLIFTSSHPHGYINKIVPHLIGLLIDKKNPAVKSHLFKRDSTTEHIIYSARE